MHLARFVIHLIDIEPAPEVLRHASAEPDGFAQRHVMKKPMRQPRPGTCQSVAGAGQRRSGEIVGRIPIAEITPVKNREYSLDIGMSEIAGVAQTSDVV